MDNTIVGEENVGFYENGQIQYTIQCANDSCVRFEYNEEYSVRYLSVGDKLITEEAKCLNGNIMFVKRLGVGVQEYKEYFCNGNIKKKGALNEHGIFVGLYSSYFENGQVRAIGSYSVTSPFESKKEGKWLYFDLGGNTILEEDYRNGVLISND